MPSLNNLPSLSLAALTISLSLAAGPSLAAEPLPTATASKNKVEVELAADVTSVAPGETFRLGVFIRPDPGWHVYWKFAGDTGLPTEVHWAQVEGIDFDHMAWPVPNRYVDKLGGRSFGYEKEVLLTTRVRAPEDLLEGSELPLEAKVEWLVCKENCIQGSARVGLKLPVRELPEAERRSDRHAVFEAWARRVPLAAPPAGLTVEASVDGAPVAPGDAFKVRLVLGAATPIALHEPLAEAFLPATEGLEVTAIDKKAGPDDKSVVLELSGKAAGEGELVSRLEGVVRVLIDGAPIAFDTRIEVPRKPGPAVVPAPALGAGPTLPAPPPAGPAIGALGADEDPCAHADLSGGGDERLSSFALALLFAFIGGLILNAMPCVLPVLSLKILGVVQQSQDAPKVIWRHGLVYTAGVLVSFLVFAILLLVLQQTSWAFQFQDPTFVAIFSAIVFAFGLSLFGVFELALPGAHRLDAAVAGSHGYMSSFNYGIFAVLLGTPCTAPFLGPALTYAFTQPPLMMTLLLLTVGLGLAFPFLLLARFPGWRRFLPKPGPWLVTFKKVMGFFLIGTAVFLLSILAAQVSRDALVGYLIFLAVLSFALWIYGHWTSPERGTRARWIATGVAVALTTGAAALFVSVEPPPAGPGAETIAGVTWHDFDQTDPIQHARDGRLVFVDFTADWCATCKVNEATAIHTDATRALFEKLGVMTIKGDFTVHKPAIAEWLQRFEEPSVPLYVVIPAGRPDEAFKLAPLISEADVRDGICRAHRLVTTASASR